MRRVVTIIKCDRCPRTITLNSKKRLIRGYRIEKYPTAWHQVENDMLCDKCAEEFREIYNKFKTEVKQIEQPSA